MWLYLVRFSICALWLTRLCFRIRRIRVLKCSSWFHTFHLHLQNTKLSSFFTVFTHSSCNQTGLSSSIPFYFDYKFNPPILEESKVWYSNSKLFTKSSLFVLSACILELWCTLYVDLRMTWSGWSSMISLVHCDFEF